MVNIDAFRNGAASHAWRRWFTNRIKRVLWAVIGPLVIRVGKRILAEIGGEAAAEYDGIMKDVIAIRHRLSSIESTISVEYQAAYDLQTVKNRLGALDSGLVCVAQEQGCFLIHRPDVVGDAIAAGAFWDEYLKVLITEYADRERIAIDVGAYIGVHSVFMSRHFKTVYSFEPRRYIFNILRANLALNVCENVVALNKGLYDRECALQIAPDQNQEIPIPRRGQHVDCDRLENAASLTFEIADEHSRDAVPAITIDSLNLSDVALLKIDAQGADMRILKGARHTIESCRPVIAFELERELARQHQFNEGCVEDFFSSLNYSLIVARSDPNGKQTDFIAYPCTDKFRSSFPFASAPERDGKVESESGDWRSPVSRLPLVRAAGVGGSRRPLRK
jgi:FkbM family methyltransferase